MSVFGNISSRSIEADVSSKAKFRFFPNEAKMQSLAKVLAVRKASRCHELTVVCKGLDCLGFVFDLEMIFSPDDAATVASISDEMKIGSVYVCEGHFVFQNGAVKLYDPSYGPIKDEFADKVQIVFNTNQNGLELLAA